MRTRYGILAGFILLAILSMAGACAAEETGTGTIADGQPLPPTGPGYNMSGNPRSWDYNYDDNWSRDYSRDYNRDYNRSRDYSRDYNRDYNWSGTMGTPPYHGNIGADHSLYGLKIAFENLDESFTFNETERIEKQIDHGRMRLSEFMRELQLNRTESADRVLSLYREKMNQTEMTLAPFASNGTGLLHAQEMIAKHQMVLENLMSEHPGNAGLVNAVNNSGRLQNRFEEKTKVRLEQGTGRDNMPVFNAVPPGEQEQRRSGGQNGAGPSVAGSTNATAGRNPGQGSGQDNRNTGQQNPGQGSGQDNRNTGQQNPGQGSGQDNRNAGQQNPGQGSGQQQPGQNGGRNR